MSRTKARAFFRDPNFDYLELQRKKMLEARIAEEEGVPAFFFEADWVEKGELHPDQKRIRSLPIRIMRSGTQVKSLKKYELLVSSFLGYQGRFYSEIRKLDGLCNLDERDELACALWPRVVEPEFVRRKVGVVLAEEIANIASYCSEDGVVFAKKVNKTYDGWGKVIPVEDARCALEDGLSYKDRHLPNSKMVVKLHPEDLVLVSEPVEFLRANENTQEYRIWVMNHVPVSITDYHFPDGFCSRNELVDFAERFTQAHNQVLPNHYVLDVGMTLKDDELRPVVVEVNSFCEVGNRGSDEFIQENFRRIVKGYLSD